MEGGQSPTNGPSRVVIPRELGDDEEA